MSDLICFKSKVYTENTQRKLLRVTRESLPRLTQKENAKVYVSSSFTMTVIPLYIILKFFMLDLRKTIDNSLFKFT